MFECNISGIGYRAPGLITQHPGDWHWTPGHGTQHRNRAMPNGGNGQRALGSNVQYNNNNKKQGAVPIPED